MLYSISRRQHHFHNATTMFKQSFECIAYLTHKAIEHLRYQRIDMCGTLFCRWLSWDLLSAHYCLRFCNTFTLTDFAGVTFFKEKTHIYITLAIYYNKGENCLNIAVFDSQDVFRNCKRLYSFIHVSIFLVDRGLQPC